MNIFHNIGNIHTTESNYSSTIYKKEIDSFRSLWRAVITQALIDASSNSKKKFAKKQKIEALRWLIDDKKNGNLKRVCCLADLEYYEVLKKVKIALSKGCRWRNDKKNNIPIHMDYS